MENLDHSNQSDSDSDDSDFVPDGPESDVSEEEDNTTGSGATTPINGKFSKSGKRKSKSKRKRKSAKNKNVDSGDETTDDDFDPSFTGDNSLAGEANVEEDEKSKAVNEEAEKKRTDRLWSDFLSGVEQISQRKKPDSTQSETTVKKVYDFAGEKVEVEEKVQIPSTNGAANDIDSNKKFNTSFPSSSGVASSSSSASTSSSSSFISSTGNGGSLSNIKSTTTAGPGIPPVRRGGISFLSGKPSQIGLAAKPGAKRIGGLQAVLSAIQDKKQKMGTLEKSRLDWQEFKKKEGLEEELKTHVKSKDSYIERQEFLTRSDVRQFEIEKGLRTRARRNP